MNAVIRLEHVSLHLQSGGQPVPILADVSLAIEPAEMLGLVGESGSGKSMTVRTINRLLPAGAVVGGQVWFGEHDLQTISGSRLREVRTSGLATVFQDPRAHINPIRRIGDFLIEALVTNLKVDRDEATERAAALLEEVGIDDHRRRLRQYPHEMSGGMLQRVMIAAALTCDPKLLLADEPTTALDVTIQGEIMAILQDLRERRGMAILFITHDLELAAATCDRIAVMYAGRLVEQQHAAGLFERPGHPYTKGLLGARPHVGGPPHRLQDIPGRPARLGEFGGCSFAPRCVHADDDCCTEVPTRRELEGGGWACCVRPEGALDG